ncbi:NmrA family NAD(P)-binding protein [Massilia aurea]|uniref:NmrA family NAD(P)-binding protein n=1 Tax=Massilia aurea TaxID=373040 RepID=UPI0021613383|nr:NmrA family NAD(P)-binding protein [Massilia aurea]MCS0705530.1 NmrA family NAD(P)-binding protein [Massilia aurea]
MQNTPDQHSRERRVTLAGITGDLGARIGRALIAQGASVNAIVRPGTAPDKLAALRALGVDVKAVEMRDAAGLRAAMRGSVCIVSALNGLAPVVIDTQQNLLDAAVAEGVVRFIPSDYSLDFTKTIPGENRNLDLRRRFMATLDAAPIRATSVLNGGFIDLLAGQAPIIAAGIRRVIHFGDAQQQLDFTSKDDVATFTAAAAMDDAAPRILRIAGDTVSPVDLARIMTEVTGQRYATLRVGSIGALSAMIAITRKLSPASDAPFPAWQGMQYLRDMMSGRGKLHPLDNDRYGVRAWTGAHEVLEEIHAG